MITIAKPACRPDDPAFFTFDVNSPFHSTSTFSGFKCVKALKQGQVVMSSHSASNEIAIFVRVQKAPPSQI
jgi:hypothetical protein